MKARVHDLSSCPIVGMSEFQDCDKIPGLRGANVLTM